MSLVRFTKQMIYQIFWGFGCAIRGFILSWNNPYVWSTQTRSLFSLLICTSIVYIILVILFIPFRIFVWFLSLIYKMSPSEIEWFENVSSARSLLFHLISFIPLLGVFVMNNLLGYDKLFFSVLGTVNPSLAERLNARPRQPFTSSLFYFARRTLNLFFFLICLHFLRSLPFIGQFVPALWVFRYARYTVTNTEHVYLRTFFFLLLILLTIFQSLHDHVLWCLKLQMASTALARELFDTYLSRIHTSTTKSTSSVQVPTHPPPSRYHFLGFPVPSLFSPFFNPPINMNPSQPDNNVTLPHRKIQEFLRENYFLLLAFAFPYIFLFSIPLLGFICVGYAHGAAAYTLGILFK